MEEGPISWHSLLRNEGEKLHNTSSRCTEVFGSEIVILDGRLVSV